jgi:hypothetical protein
MGKLNATFNLYTRPTFSHGALRVPAMSSTYRMPLSLFLSRAEV